MPKYSMQFQFLVCLPFLMAYSKVNSMNYDHQITADAIISRKCIRQVFIYMNFTASFSKCILISLTSFTGIQNSMRKFTHHFHKIHFTIITPPLPRPPKWYLPLRISSWHFVHIVVAIKMTSMEWFLYSVRRAISVVTSHFRWNMAQTCGRCSASIMSWILLLKVWNDCAGWNLWLGQAGDAGLLRWLRRVNVCR
jgi:hypothetical protein